MATPILDRIMAKVVINPETDCWEFMGAQTRGYGVIGKEGGRRCCNPRHLEAVTQAENNRRAARDNPITHCKNGHEFTPENTVWTKPDAPYRQQRGCVICRRAKNLATYHRNKARQASEPEAKDAA
jgi:hypothetical protein